MRLIALLAVVMAVTTGCQPVVLGTCARLPGGGDYCLQPTTTLAAFEATQRVDVTIGERTETLVVVLEIDSGSFRLAALTPFGQQLLEMNYDNRLLHVTTPVSARHLDPVLLASVIQFCLWPEDAVRRGLSGPLVLEHIQGTRRLMRDDAAVMTVAREGDAPPFRELRLTVPEAGLTAVVETLESPSPESQ